MIAFLTAADSADGRLSMLQSLSRFAAIGAGVVGLKADNKNREMELTWQIFRQGKQSANEDIEKVKFNKTLQLHAHSL